MKQALGWPGAIVLVTLMTVLSVATAKETMYRWVDVDGNVNYSDRPPPAGAEQVKALNQGQPVSDITAESTGESTSYAEQEAEFQERRKQRAEAQAEASKKAETAALWNKNCDLARANLQTVTNPPGGRLRERNADGTPWTIPTLPPLPVISSLARSPHATHLRAGCLHADSIALNITHSPREWDLW